MMLNRSNCDRMSNLSGILTETLNPRDKVCLFIRLIFKKNNGQHSYPFLLESLQPLDPCMYSLPWELATFGSLHVLPPMRACNLWTPACTPSLESLQPLDPCMYSLPWELATFGSLHVLPPLRVCNVWITACTPSIESLQRLDHCMYSLPWESVTFGSLHEEIGSILFCCLSNFWWEISNYRGKYEYL